MATFKTCIFAHHKKQDGTVNVKLRVLHHGEHRHMSTNIYVTENDLTAGLKIRNAAVKGLCLALEQKCIAICNGLNYALDNMSIDELVERLRYELRGGDRFRLDFIEYMRNSAATMSKGTAGLYITTSNAIMRFTGRKSLDMSEVTTDFLRGFEAFLRQEPSQRGGNRAKDKEAGEKAKGGRAVSLYMARIRAIHNRAKEEFNDESRGIVRIPYSPFKKYSIETPANTPKRALSHKVMQKLIDLPPFDQKRAQLARDWNT